MSRPLRRQRLRQRFWVPLGLLATLPLLLPLTPRATAPPAQSPPAAGAPEAALVDPGLPAPGADAARKALRAAPHGQDPAPRAALAPGPPPPAAAGPPPAAATRIPHSVRWPTTADAEASVRALLELVSLAVSQERYGEMEDIIAAIKAYGPAAISPLLDVLRENDGSRLPLYAAVILGEMEAEQPDPALARVLRESALPLVDDLALASDDPSLRHAALVALGKIGDPASFDLLVDALARERSSLIGEQALRSLAALRGAEATEALAGLAREEPDPALRRSLVEALAAREDPAAIGTLEALARSDYSDGVRLEAVRGLAALSGPEARALLREIARSPESAPLRAAALRGLGAGGDEADLGLLEDALRFSTSNEVRTAAYGGLARIGTRVARRVLDDYRPAARLDRVFPGTNADASGLEPDDLVLAYDGEPVGGAEDFKALIDRSRPSRVISLEIVRDGRQITLAVTGGFLGVAIEDGVARN